MTAHLCQFCGRPATSAPYVDNEGIGHPAKCDDPFCEMA